MNIIKEKRQILGYSQHDLSDRCGVNFRTLQDYEQGRKSLLLAKSEVIYRLSQVLNCTMEELLLCSTDYPKEASLHRMTLYSSSLSPQEIIGSVNIIIDDLVPCLKNTITGIEEDTVVFKIESKSYLKNFNSSNGWHINWNKVPKDVDVYALATKSNNEIQGLIGLRNDSSADAVYIHWICSAPHNNIHEFGTQKYTGVGAHLFAIAADMSFKYGHDGYIYGYASSNDLLEHYKNKFNAQHVPCNHIFQFIIDEDNSRRLMEIYNYEWNNC